MDDRGHINVASRLPPQQADAVVAGHRYEKHGKQGEVRAASHQRQQQQILAHQHQQLPRKAPSRGVIEEFMLPVSIILYPIDHLSHWLKLFSNFVLELQLLFSILE